MRKFLVLFYMICLLLPVPVCAKNYTEASNILYIVFPLLLLLFSLFIIKRYRYENESEIDLTLFNSLEMSYLYRGNIRVLDVVSIIFHLANLGYLSIKNCGSGQKAQYQLIKEKEYDKENANEKIIFDGLFQNNEEVDIKGINGIFAPYLEDIRNIIETKKNYEKIFSVRLKWYRDILSIFFLLCVTITQTKAFYCLLHIYIFAILLSFFIGTILIILLRRDDVKKYNVIYGIICVIFFLDVYALWNHKIYLLIYTVCWGLITSFIYFYSKLPIRTEYGYALFTKIEAFKTILVHMDIKEKQEKVKENSNYFYDMLPYAIVFGITGQWVQSFNEEVFEKPFWYHSSGPYTKQSLVKCLEIVIPSLLVYLQTNSKVTDELLNQAPNKVL